MYAHLTGLVLRIVPEELLLIDILLAFVGIVRTAIHFASVLRVHGEMIGNIHAVVHQLGLQLLVERLEVDTFLQGLVAGGIEDTIHHIVEQGLLIDVAVPHNLTHRLRSLIDRVLVVTQNQRLGHLRGFERGGLEHERGVHVPVLVGHRVLVRLLQRAVGRTASSPHGVATVCATLCLVDVFLQIAKRFIQLEVTRCLIERFVHRLVELLLLHLNHLVDVFQLEEEQGQETEAHDHRYCPNRSFLHRCKGNELSDYLCYFR